MKSQNNDGLVADVVDGLEEVTADLSVATEIIPKMALQCGDRKFAYLETEKIQRSLGLAINSFTAA